MAVSTVYNIEYHFVWVTKYRYKVLTGDVALRVREMVRQTCEIFEIKILQGVVSKDHVHTLVSAPPHMAPSEIMRRIKGRTSSKLCEEFPMLKSATGGDTAGHEAISVPPLGNDRRDGARIFGPSLRARSARQLSHGVITTALTRIRTFSP